VKINFNLTEDDYVRFYIDHFWKCNSNRKNIVMLRTVPIIACIFLLATSRFNWVYIVFFSTFFFIIWNIFLKQIMRSSVKKDAFKSIRSGRTPNFSGFREVSLSDDCIEEVGLGASFSVQYAAIECICFGRGLVYIYSSLATAAIPQTIIIPFSAFSHEDQRHTFIGFLFEKAGCSKSPAELSKALQMYLPENRNIICRFFEQLSAVLIRLHENKNKRFESLRQKINWRFCVLLTVIFFMLFLLVNLSGSGIVGLRRVSPGADTLSSVNGYTYAEALNVLSTLGEAGRSFYSSRILPMDFLYKFSILLFCSGWILLTGKHVRKESLHRRLLLFPALSLLLGWTENICIILMLYNYPSLPMRALFAASISSVLRVAANTGSFAVVFFLILAFFVKKIRKEL